MENIFNKAMPLLTLVNNNHHNFNEVVAEILIVLQELENYHRNINNQDDVNVRRAYKLLQELHIKAGINAAIVFNEGLDNISGLHQRIEKNYLLMS
jgi:hypothetical protein